MLILFQSGGEGGEKIEEVRNAPETKYNAVRPALGHEGEREEGEIQCKILIGHK